MIRSYFDGSILGLLGTYLLGTLITLCTLGIAYPWGIVIIKRWEVEHTVIEGRRLMFTGTGAQLFGNWIKWWLLTIITFGIYGFWVGLKIRQWETKHTIFAD